MAPHVLVGEICISCKIVHQIAPLALVANLATTCITCITGITLCLAHEIIAMYSVDEITCTFTISGLAGRFEERFCIHIVNIVHWGCF